MYASIFIPTGNRADSLNRVLSSLVKQTFKDFEALIVNYKSTDATDSVIKNYGKRLRIKVIQQRTKGLSKAANLALKVAKGKIFIRTDDDVVMSSSWLRSIHDTFESDKKIGGVTGPTVIPQSFRKNRDLFIIEERFKNGEIGRAHV